MITIRGRYDGNVVVLEEPAPVDHAVDVQVGFPTEDEETTAQDDRFGWNKTRGIRDGYHGSVADEVIRQRRSDD
jgi:hypothetical protein